MSRLHLPHLPHLPTNPIRDDEKLTPALMVLAGSESVPALTDSTRTKEHNLPLEAESFALPCQNSSFSLPYPLAFSHPQDARYNLIPRLTKLGLYRLRSVPERPSQLLVQLPGVEFFEVDRHNKHFALIMGLFNQGIITFNPYAFSLFSGLLLTDYYCNPDLLFLTIEVSPSVRRTPLLF